MIKPECKARAISEINRLIDEGEVILDQCSLEKFMEDGGEDARQNTIETWLAKAHYQTSELLVDPNDATPLNRVQLAEAIEALAPQPPTVAQLRRAFVDFINERLRLLKSMIGH